MPHWDCATCKEWQKAERGCDTTPVVPQEIDGEVLTRCPLRPSLDYRASFAGIYTLYSWYKRGMMPDQGTYLDQAAACVQLIQVMDKAVADAEAVKEKADKARANVIRKPQGR